MMKLGDYLKEARVAKGLTQEEVASELNISYRSISRYESDEEPVNSKNFRKYCEYLGITIDDIKRIVITNGDKDISCLNPVTLLNQIDYSTKQQITIQLEKKITTAFNYAKEGKYEDALSIYLAFEILLSCEFVYLGCATMYHLMGKSQLAIEYSDKILAITEGRYTYEALLIKGVSLGELKDYNTSIEILERAVQIKESYSVYFNLGISYQFNNNRDAAMEKYNKCLKLNQDFASAHLNIGICYFDMMQLQKFLYHMDRAIRLKPNMYQAYGKKGEYYRSLEDYDNAIKYFSKCLELDETNYQALLGIASSLAIKDSIVESSIYFRKLFKLYSDIYFGKDKKLGKTCLMVDIGWKLIHYFRFTYVSKNIVNVDINGFSMPINLNEDSSQIFIGAVQICDQTGSMMYPMVGKFYNDVQEFREVINRIKSSIELFQYFNGPVYINFNNNINVEITERESNVKVDINFNNTYRIIGITDTKGNGVNAFLDNYNNKVGQLRIHLECDGEMFIIDGIKNVKLNLL